MEGPGTGRETKGEAEGEKGKGGILKGIGGGGAGRTNRRGSLSAVATVEPKAGSNVPVLIWEIEPEDERNLDIYEGYPRLYGKVDLEVQTEDGSESIMAYTMNEGHEIGKPSMRYLETITTGYLEAGFDVNRLLQSVSYCKEIVERRYENGGMEEQAWNQQLLQ